MKLKTILLVAALAVAAPTWSQHRAERQSVMLNAKDLVVKTKQNTTYYYLISSEDSPVVHFEGGQVRIFDDVFAMTDIQSLRLHALPRFLLDEDSTTYDKNQTVDHGLMALRRSLTVGKWNSLTLPVNLTGEQVAYAFGEGTEIAVPRGIRENDVTVVEFETQELTPSEVAIKAGYHYLIRPTREPDLSAESWTSALFTGKRIYGPVYYVPNVSTSNVKAPRTQPFSSADESVTVYFRGTFYKLDDSVVTDSRITNKRIDAGTYMLSDDALMVKNQEAAEVKAFTSWVQDMSDPKQDQLRFYVDGVNEDISEFPDAVAALQKEAVTDDAVYDLGGRRVGTASMRSSLKAGVYVIGGKKVVIK